MEFLKRTGPSGGSSIQCQHCKTHIPSLHRHANTKIFQLPSRKGKAVLDTADMITSTVEPITKDDEDEMLLSESSTEDEAGRRTRGRGQRSNASKPSLNRSPAPCQCRDEILDTIARSRTAGKALEQ